MLLFLVASFLAAPTEPHRLTLTKGEIREYELKQTTKATETLLEEGKERTTVTESSVRLTRRWEVKAAEEQQATLEMTITSFRQEIRRPGPDGKIETIIVDSSAPDAKETSFVGKPLAEVVLDHRGRVKSAKSATGPAAEKKLRAELPFRIEFPEKAETEWNQDFEMVLEQLGSSDPVVFVRKGRITKNDSLVEIETSILPKKEPAAADYPTIAPLLWEGVLKFKKSPAGLHYQGARLKVQRTIPNHQGEKTKLQYESELEETIKK